MAGEHMADLRQRIDGIDPQAVVRVAAGGWRRAQPRVLPPRLREIDDER